jgi:arylsulfatase B
MTGRYPIRFGMQRTVCRPWATYGLPSDEEMLGEMLARGGYEKRAIVGKWHLGHTVPAHHPLNQGFTFFYGHYNGALDYWDHDREGQLDWHRDFLSSYDTGYTTFLVRDEAVDFIHQNAGGAAPFFLYVPFNAVHTPLQAPQSYIDLYPALTGNRKTYAGMVACMDEAIGDILQALDDEGVANDTVVLFFCDNGAMGQGASSGPLRDDKGSVFEGGVRVPAAIRWPAGLTGGTTLDVPMYYIDVFPTFQRIAGAGAGPGKPLDGLDMLDVLKGTAPAPDRDFYSYIGGENNEKTAVMTSQWKLVRIGPNILDDPPAGEVDLYLFRIDLDPYELTDLAASEPAVVSLLLEKLRTFRALRSPGGLTPSGSPPDGWSAPPEWLIPGLSAVRDWLGLG